MNGSIAVHTTPWPTGSYLMLIRLSNGFQALIGGLEFSSLVAQPLAFSSSSLQDMVGSEDIAVKLTKIPVYVDSANLPLKTQSIFGPPVGHLMGSDMLFAKTAKLMTVLSHFLNPLCGQSRNSSGSFEIQKWLSCWLARGHNKNHCKNWFRLHFPSYVADIFIGDWHSFLVRSKSWHISVSPLLPTKGFAIPSWGILFEIVKLKKKLECILF